MDSRPRVSSTSVKPPTSAHLPPTPSSPSPASPFTSASLLHDQLWAWGEDFSPRSSDSETILASSSLHTESGFPSDDTKIAEEVQSRDEGDSDADLYMMSGALHESDPHPTEIHSYAELDESATICKDSLSSLMHHQPFRLLNCDGIYYYIGDWLNNPGLIYHYYGDEFLTTVYGIKLALEEVHAYKEWDDTMLLGAIKYKGGVVSGYKSVVYPEDIEPSIGEYDPWHEWEYWEKLRDQGRVWEEAGLIDQTPPQALRNDQDMGWSDLTTM